MKKENVFKVTFASIYPLYLLKVTRKGRTNEELDEVLYWLTGYNESSLQEQINKEVSLETFFEEAPKLNPNVDKIKGVVCGVRVEEIEDPLMQKIRWMDKRIDELARGKAMEKILRQ